MSSCLSCALFRHPWSSLLGEPAGAALDQLAEAARAALAAEGFTGDAAVLQLQLDLRFAGQDSELILDVERSELCAAGLAALADRFRAENQRLFAYDTDEPVEVVNLRIAARGLRTKAELRGRTEVARPDHQEPTHRPVWWPTDDAPTATPVIPQRTLGPEPFVGPLIVEAYDSTLVVAPGWQGRLDPRGHILLERT